MSSAIKRKSYNYEQLCIVSISLTKGNNWVQKYKFSLCQQNNHRYFKKHHTIFGIFMNYHYLCNRKQTIHEENSCLLRIIPIR